VTVEVDLLCSFGLDLRVMLVSLSALAGDRIALESLRVRISIVGGHAARVPVALAGAKGLP
jgi:hypothetical protein